jgi:hypothetical protein
LQAALQPGPGRPGRGRGRGGPCRVADPPPAGPAGPGQCGPRVGAARAPAWPRPRARASSWAALTACAAPAEPVAEPGGRAGAGRRPPGRAGPSRACTRPRPRWRPPRPATARPGRSSRRPRRPWTTRPARRAKPRPSTAAGQAGRAGRAGGASPRPRPRWPRPGRTSWPDIARLQASVGQRPASTSSARPTCRCAPPRCSRPARWAWRNSATRWPASRPGGPAGGRAAAPRPGAGLAVPHAGRQAPGHAGPSAGAAAAAPAALPAAAAAGRAGGDHRGAGAGPAAAPGPQGQPEVGRWASSASAPASSWR